MKSLILLLAGASVLLVSPPAHALPESKTFAAFIDEGPVLEPTGSLDFTLVEATSAKLGNGWDVVCRYFMLWTPPNDRPYATYCTVDEFTWQGQRSCVQNAQTALDTIIMKVPNSPCAGFDYLGITHNVFQMVAGESDEGLYGLLQWSAAAAHVTGFRAYAG